MVTETPRVDHMMCAYMQNAKGPYRTMEELWDEPELD